jgi:hypothetical protein
MTHRLAQQHAPSSSVDTKIAKVSKRIVSSKQTDGESTAGAPRIESEIQVKTRSKVIKEGVGEVKR